MRAKELIDDPILEDELAEALGILVSQVLKRSQTKTKDDNGHEPDRLLTLEEAAERLKVSRSWLYRRSRKDLPFAVHTGRKLSFSERGIEKYIADKCGKSLS